MDTTLVVRALAMPLRVLPSVLLVTFAGVLGIAALMFRAERRQYASDLVHAWTTAACEIATGQRSVSRLARGNTARKRSARERTEDNTGTGSQAPDEQVPAELG